MTTSTSAPDLRNAIVSANGQFMAAFRRGDAAGVAGIYSREGQLLPAHSDFVLGTAAIQRFWQGMMDLGIKEAVLETIELESRGDLAWEVGRYTLKAAGEQLADAGKYLVIWKQEAGTWRLHRDIWTTSRAAG